MDNYLQYVSDTVGVATIAASAAVATVFYINNSSSIMYPNVDVNNQSMEVPNSGGARQSRLSPPGEVTGFLYDDAKTIFEAMQRGYRLSGNGPCVGYRKTAKSEYSWLTYSEVIARARNLACGFVSLGMKPGQSSLIGIYSQNCVEWIITEQACYNQSSVIVPLYDTLGPKACSFIINQAEMSIVVCDKEEKVRSLLEQIDDTPGLKHIILMKEVTKEIKEAAEDKGVKMHTFLEIEELGKKNPVEVLPPKPSDVATISYTSGTTGDPKGVMLTHANIITDVCACIIHLGDHAPTKADTAMSFLPLAHMLERLCEISLYIAGGRVGFYRGDIKTLMDDMKTLRPTVTVAVPRVLNKIYDKVHANIKGSKIKRVLFDLAMSVKTSELERFKIRNNSIWDRLVFKPVRQGMGGRTRLLVVGSAPLAGNVLTFIRCALGCLVTEGYGQTECVAPCTYNIAGDFAVGQVGAPLPCCHIKLVDVPEMGYFAAQQKGEVCVKGNNVFKGYYKNPEKTAETLDADGWLHTGDIGEWLPNGSLKIVDRKKNIFKLAQGEYIAPEKIENVYLCSPYVSQIFVHGESLQSVLVAVVVPDEESVLEWCKENKIAGTWADICKNKAVKQLILKDITRLGKTAGLKSFEQVKDIHLHPELFSIDNGLMTPTLKTKRPDCKKYFVEVIEDMYRAMA